MAYGQTGSGKTYTMVGDDHNPGLYFTAVDEMYKIVKDRSKQMEYELTVSVIEIYNESVRDLLHKDQNKNEIKLLENREGLYGD